MKEITSVDFLQVDNDDVVAIQIDNGRVTVLYMIEEWEEAFEQGGFEDDTYRFYGYGDLFIHNDWTLDDKELTDGGLVWAVGEQQGRCCGGMYFYHEEDDREGYVNVFDHFYKEVINTCENASILEMTMDEWKQNWKELKDGNYIIVIVNSAREEG